MQGGRDLLIAGGSRSAVGADPGGPMTLFLMPAILAMLAQAQPGGWDEPLAVPGMVAAGGRLFAFGGGSSFWESLPDSSWVPRGEPVSYRSTGAGVALVAGSAFGPASANFIFAVRGGTQPDFWRYDILHDDWSEL